MFIKWDHPSVRLTGRWSLLESDVTDIHIFVKPTARYTATTAAGSYFELAFSGRMALLHFDLGYLIQPFPHLWIQVDGGAMIEVPVDRHLRIDALTDGDHIVKVLYKGGMEQLNRWYLPLAGAISFVGADVDAPASLPADDRPIIEFIGDSITEGVLIDVGYAQAQENVIDQFDRVYQDDNCATYASLTAGMLNMRAMFQAYGAVGLTRAGCGGVPRAGLLYPYVFDGVPYTGEKPDVIVINHGTNDHAAEPAEYIMRYREFIDMVRKINPDATIICLGPFRGYFDAELTAFAAEYNAAHEKPIHYVSAVGWIEPEPLHPLRDGHMTVAQHLAPIIKGILDAK